MVVAVVLVVVVEVEQPGWLGQAAVREALEVASCCGICDRPSGAKLCTPHSERASPFNADQSCKMQLNRRPAHFCPCRSRSTS